MTAMFALTNAAALTMTEKRSRGRERFLLYGLHKGELSERQKSRLAASSKDIYSNAKITKLESHSELDVKRNSLQKIGRRSDGQI